MRKYQQQQILALLKTIEEALSASLFSDCKEGAEYIIRFIESIVGKVSTSKGTTSVSLLKEFCEMLSVESSQDIDLKVLKKKLIKIENSIAEELKPTRLEVVFFPYQLSMFDSFRSVYLAAKADPACDVYCVPIPWFNRDTNGSLSTAHYDGYEYPADIEVVDWRTYDVASRHPDVVFVHNPYDDYNLVTSVHPNYYSRELKNKTDLLVYIDYGLPAWVSKTPIAGTLVPSLTTYDVFTAYSEEYAHCLRFHFNNAAGCIIKPEQDSVAVLGSPKFDMVINTKKQDYVLPDKWQECIRGKKVLLFSTSLGALLKNSEMFLNDIRYVLETLRKHEDIVLWWRPHPLSEETFASMRPQLLAEYKNIVNNFNEEGLGIYDNTPDLHRAIAWSDACYSDESSLMFLYLATQKPFSIRMTELPENCIDDTALDFTSILETRIKNMQTVEGANIFDANCVIWWHNFANADYTNNLRYDNFLERFIHFILNESEYPQAGTYKELKAQMFHRFVENSDGSAGQKIYDYVKQKVWGVN